MKTRETGNEKLTPKQLKYIAFRAKNPTLSKQDAVRYAGYAPSVQAGQIENKTMVKEKLIKALKRQGVDEDFLAEKIRDGLTAEETRDFPHQGEIVSSRTYPDHSVRHKYLETSLTLAGFIKTNSIEQINVGIVAIPVESSREAWDGEAVVTSQSQVNPTDDVDKPNA